MKDDSMTPFAVRPDPGVNLREIVFGAAALSIEDVLTVGRQGAIVRLSDDPGFTSRITEGAAFVERLLDEDGVIYGVTTGYGDSCTEGVPRELVEELPLQLTRFHGCGLGAHLSHDAARAVLATRLASLCRGFSGVRLELLERLVDLLNLDLVPLIPEEGSVGASGDLTPLSYVAALLVGEREASHGGVTLPAAEAHRRLGLEPLALRPKEGLALMNGTAVMTALGSRPASPRSRALHSPATAITSTSACSRPSRTRAASRSRPGCGRTSSSALRRAMRAGCRIATRSAAHPT
jgi:histidine ammonia-lyase